MNALAGRHALVTGANRGIGAAIAQALSAGGARVTLMVRDAAAGEAVAAGLPTPHTVVVADVTDRAATQAACAEAAERLGAVDILVNNAGVAGSAPFMKSGPDLFERMIAVHLYGAVHATQAVLPGMLERGRGHIVNVASTAGLQGAPYVTAYTAAKHALVGLTRALALEVEAKGVAVCAVCPGYTDTDLVREAIARIVAKTGKSEADALAAVLAASGQRQLVTVDDVAAAVVALCRAPEADAAGRVVTLDGAAAR